MKCGFFGEFKHKPSYFTLLLFPPPAAGIVIGYLQCITSPVCGSSSVKGHERDKSEQRKNKNDKEFKERNQEKRRLYPQLLPD